MPLQPSHHVETLLQGSILSQTHPLVFVVLSPLHLSQVASNPLTQFSYLRLHLWVHHCDVENLGRGIWVGRSARALALVLVFFLLIGGFPKDERVVVRVEDLEGRFGIVDFILGLDGIDESLKLDERTVFFLDEDDSGDFAEVGKNVVETIMIIVLWK